MNTNYEMHVISNTHWDREWSANFQETRMRLVEFLDALLDILDRRSDYKSFLLDSQAVPIEDYLEARPENRKRIEKHVAGGRLLIGPWYTCPEEFSVNGESIVRNLLYGHRVAEAFGSVMKVGYSPFSYGQNSQMPQIYTGFGIESILFYHGVTHDEVSNEFIFEGADGTQIFASQMSSNARYNFYHDVYRKVVWDYEKDERIYTWATGGLPFHSSSEAHCDEQYFLLDSLPRFNAERVESCIQELRDTEITTATTPYLAFMMGHDASVADEDVLRIIELAQDSIGSDTLMHSSLPDLIGKVQDAADSLPILKGERRTPKVRSGRVHLNSNVLSSRTRMKHLNARAEETLQRWAEPYATVALCLGKTYPGPLLDLAWRELLKGHAHDSISGSGVDDIEMDMTHRLRQVLGICRSVTHRCLAHIQSRIDNSNEALGDILLTVFNASPNARSEILTAVVDVPPGVVSREFDLLDAESGTPIPVQVATRKPHHVVVYNPKDAAHTMKCERFTLHFNADEIPALGYATFRLNPKGSFERGDLARGQNSMENEHLELRINVDGTLCARHKASGTTYDGLHYFEDSGEAGQAWKHIEPGIDGVISSHGFPVSIARVESGPLLARYRIDYHMIIPAGLDNAGSDVWDRLDGFDNAARRSEETRDLRITSIVTLRKGARSVEVRTRFHNSSEMHRLRVMFPTRLAGTNTCYAESAFDVVERPIEPPPGDPWHGIGPRTHTMLRFIDVSDGKAGLAVINDGLREYEVTQDREKSIAVTLMRAYEVSVCSSAAGWETHPGMKLSQSFGDHEFQYFIHPHAGRWDEAEVCREVERLNTPMEPVQAGRHGGDLPQRLSFLDVRPAGLLLSALKQSEDKQALVLRIYNPTPNGVDGTLTFFQTIQSASLITLEELPVRDLQPDGKSLRLRVEAKKIATLRVQLAE